MLDLPLRLKKVTLPNRVFLAPMSGVTDGPFRARAQAAGAGMVVSEMVASAQLCRGSDESQRRLLFGARGIPVVQLAGYDPHWLAEAAKIAQDRGAAIIDINMGCPAKKVVGKACGAALMCELDHARKIIAAVVKAVPLDITVKMRLGWDENNKNAVELAKIAQGEGASMVTVHGRTREQFYKGQADWGAIAAVRAALDIPLVANGDIKDQTDALGLLQTNVADAVMLGRATYGQPWLCGSLVGRQPPSQLGSYVIQHYEDMLDYYGITAGLRHARKHLDWYFTKHAATIYTSDLRSQLLRNEDSLQVKSLIRETFLRVEESKLASVF